MRVAYSGARRPKPSDPRPWHDLYELIEEEAVYDVMQLPKGTVVVHGGEPTGIDAAVDQAARELSLEVEVHRPDVAGHGGDFPDAAKGRNAHVTTVGPDGEARFFAAPWSRGTWDAWRKAEEAGVRRRLRRYLLEGGVRVYQWPEPEGLPRLRVRSGSLRLYYPGRVALDVTRGSGKGIGLAFAPSRALLDPFIEARRARVIPLLQKADKLLTGGVLFGSEAAAEAGALNQQAWAAEDALWASYLPQYTAEMRVSAGLTSSSPRWGQLEEAAAARGVRPHPEAWRAVLRGDVGGYDYDGVKLVVACCFCAGHFRAHCHTRILCDLWARHDGVEDGGEAEGISVARVCR